METKSINFAVTSSICWLRLTCDLGYIAHIDMYRGFEHNIFPLRKIEYHFV